MYENSDITSAESEIEMEEQTMLSNTTVRRRIISTNDIRERNKSNEKDKERKGANIGDDEEEMNCVENYDEKSCKYDSNSEGNEYEGACDIDHTNIIHLINF